MTSKWWFRPNLDWGIIRNDKLHPTTSQKKSILL